MKQSLFLIAFLFPLSSYLQDEKPDFFMLPYAHRNYWKFEDAHGNVREFKIKKYNSCFLFIMSDQEYGYNGIDTVCFQNDSVIAMNQGYRSAVSVQHQFESKSFKYFDEVIYLVETIDTITVNGNMYLNVRKYKGLIDGESLPSYYYVDEKIGVIKLDYSRRGEGIFELKKFRVRS